MMCASRASVPWLSRNCGDRDAPYSSVSSTFFLRLAVIPFVVRLLAVTRSTCVNSTGRGCRALGPTSTATAVLMEVRVHRRPLRSCPRSATATAVLVTVAASLNHRPRRRVETRSAPAVLVTAAARPTLRPWRHGETTVASPHLCVFLSRRLRGKMLIFKMTVSVK